jgi:hypothetical protein
VDLCPAFGKIFCFNRICFGTLSGTLSGTISERLLGILRTKMGDGTMFQERGSRMNGYWPSIVNNALCETSQIYDGTGSAKARYYELLRANERYYEFLRATEARQLAARFGRNDRRRLSRVLSGLGDVLIAFIGKLKEKRAEKVGAPA